MEASWVNALIGGGLIGLSATIHLLVSGRVTGVSGIYFGLFKPKENDFLWRFKFVVGLIFGGLIGSLFLSDPFVNVSGRSTLAIIAAGVLVGFGTKLGSGCTSGHGVCGISRMSPRSIVATLTFMLAGMLAVRLFAVFSVGG